MRGMKILMRMRAPLKLSTACACMRMHETKVVPVVPVVPHEYLQYPISHKGAPYVDGTTWNDLRTGRSGLLPRRVPVGRSLSRSARADLDANSGCPPGCRAPGESP